MREVITDSKVLTAILVAIVVIVVVIAVCMIIRILRGQRGYAIGPKLFANIGNAQTIGTREKQDDSFATSVRGYGIMAIVADGIGGYINGNLASQITVATFLDEFEKRDVTENLSYFFKNHQCFPMKESGMNSEKPKEERLQ